MQYIKCSRDDADKVKKNIRNDKIISRIFFAEGGRINKQMGGGFDMGQDKLCKHTLAPMAPDQEMMHQV